MASLNIPDAIYNWSVDFSKTCGSSAGQVALRLSPAWWGYATTSDMQYIEAFVRRGVRLGMYGEVDPQLLADNDDERLFIFFI